LNNAGLQLLFASLGVGHLFTKNYPCLEQSNSGIRGIPRFHGQSYTFAIGGKFAVMTIAFKKRIYR
jgi:hypothetical protein